MTDAIRPFVRAVTAAGLLLLVACISAGCAFTGHRGSTMKETFGVTADGQPVHRYTLKNSNGVTARLITLGATLTELHVPDRDGVFADVVLGFDNVEQYETQSPYFGCTTGRVANRIAGGTFELDGKTYTLATNNGPNHLHGGDKGLDKRIWSAREVDTPLGPAVRFSYFSPDGEEGYPGNVEITVQYTLTDDNELRIEYWAQTDAPTPLNLTNHSYFNLAGHYGSNILDHVLRLHADRYTPTDETLIPTGQIVPVKGTPVDFTTPTAIGERIDQMKPTTGNPPGGYDLNYVLNTDDAPLRRAATLYEPTSGRIMQVLTNEPGIQFYSGNFLDGTLIGKDGVVYNKHAGLCLETQHFPDSVNQPDFPSIIVQPNQQYYSVCIYKFDTQ